MAVNDTGSVALRPEESFSEGKEWWIFFHTIVQILILFTIVWGVITLASDRPKRFDLTTDKVHSLSDKTRTILDELEGQKVSIEAYSFIDTTQRAAGFTRDGVRYIRLMLEDLLWKYRDHTDRFRYELLDIHRQKARVEELQQEFGVTQSNVVLVVARFEDDSTRQKAVSLKDLAISPKDFMGGKLIEAFKGDEAIVQAIRTVTSTETVGVYWTIGHGEMDAREKASNLRAYLEAEAYRFDTIDLSEPGEMPEDCRVLVIASGDRPFQAPEIDKLRTYLEGGGSLLVLAEPAWESGLDGLLDEMGIAIHDDIVFAVQPFSLQTGGGDVIQSGGLIAPYFKCEQLDPRHPVTEKLAERGFKVEMSFMRSIGPSIDDPLIDYTALIRTREDQATEGPDSWGWVDYRTAAQRRGPGPDDRIGPLDLAAAVTHFFGDRAIEATPRARIVVIGDATLIEDDQIGSESNRDFIYAVLLWLAGRDPITLPPPEPKDWKIDTEDEDGNFTRTFVYLWMASGLVAFLTGIVVWIWRRV